MKTDNQIIEGLVVMMWKLNAKKNDRFYRAILRNLQDYWHVQNFFNIGF